MVKSLIDKLKKCAKSINNGAKNTLLSALAISILGLSGCSIPPPEPPIPVPEPDKNNPPKASLYVEPPYGQAPLETTVELDGEDLDGKEDITNYAVGEDKNNDDDIDDYNEMIKTGSYPLNEKIIFSTAGTYKIIGQVMDSHGAIDKKSLLVIVSNPYDPTVDLSSLDADLNEEQEKIINLPDPYDPNPEDNPVSYTNASSLDGKVDVVLNENQLTITGNEDLIGIYQVKLELENKFGEKGEAILQGEIFNLIDISGRLEDNETDSPQRGIIKIFDASDTSSPLEEIVMSSPGDFGLIQLTQPVSEAILQAVIIDGGENYTSYVRSVILDGNQDYLNIDPVYPLRVVPHPTEDLTGDGLVNQEDIEGFREHMKDINFAPYHGLLKYDLDNFTGIEIMRYHHSGSQYGFFEETIQDTIKNKILDEQDIAGYFEGQVIENGGEKELYVKGKKIKIQVDTTHPPLEPHYSPGGGDLITPELGWIVVEPDDDPAEWYDNEAGWAKRYNIAGVARQCDAGLIKMITGAYAFIICHEFGHIPTSRYHARTLPPSSTIMLYEGNIRGTPGPADLKAAPLVHDDTYKGGEGVGYIMNLRLLDEGAGDGYDLE